MTFREAVFSILKQQPSMKPNDVLAVLRKMGHTQPTQKDVDRVMEEVAFANATPIARFKDISADDLNFDVPLEKKGKVKFGVISDTHFGSKSHKRKEMEECINIMVNEKCQAILCPGDLVDGFNVYPGQANDILYNSQEDQVDEAIRGLPTLPNGMKYYWISGNHDLVWLKRSTGFDPLIPFSQTRKDVEYLGKYNAYMWVAPNICIQMNHPMRGGGMTLSYNAQKFIDGMHADRRPDILLFGHWHNPMYMYYRGIRVELCPSFQGPGDLSIRNGWDNIVGAKIIEFDLDKRGKIARYKMEEILYDAPNLKMLERRKL